MVVVLYIIYNSYLASLWNAGWTYGQSVQLAVVIWLLAGLVWIAWQRRRNPALFRKKVAVFGESADADVATAREGSEE
jgi:hypothetical protein